MMCKHSAMLLGLVLSGATEAQQLTDPTRPQLPANMQARSDGMQADGFPKLELSAVFINAKSKYAVLNGQFVNEGEEIGGALVTKVHRDGVILMNKNNQTKEFLVNNNTIKKDASNDL